MTDFLCPGCSFPLPGQSERPHTWETGKRWRDYDEKGYPTGPNIWPVHYAEPRVCQGCGGVHPEDVLRMLREGWTEEMADGHDKGYLNPPGYQAEVDAWRKATDAANRKRTPEGECPICSTTGLGDSGDPMKMYPGHPLKGPPIKFYIFHFSPEQIAELNRLHKHAKRPGI